MRKLRLKEELQVESFDTDEARAARGTVLANEQYSSLRQPLLGERLSRPVPRHDRLHAVT